MDRKKLSFTFLNMIYVTMLLFFILKKWRKNYFHKFQMCVFQLDQVPTWVNLSIKNNYSFSIELIL